MKGKSDITMKTTTRSTIFFTILALSISPMGCQVEKSKGGGNTQTNLLQSGSIHANDIKYMHRLGRMNSGSMRMDLSDPSQHRFLTARLAASGKTRKNSPRFFEMIDGIQRRHAAAKQGGTVTLKPSAQQSIADFPERDHLVADVTRLSSTPALEFKATTFATIKDGADYNFVDAVAWGEDGQQISDYGWGEEYGDGKRLIAQAEGNTASTSDPAVIQVDSVNLVSVNGVEESFYTVIDTILPAPDGDIGDPRDTNGNGQVWVCIHTNHSGCDYFLTHTGAFDIRLPFSGSITLPGELQQIYTDESETYVKISGWTGGAYPGKVETGTMEPFSSKLNVSPDRLTISWDIPNMLFKRAPFATDGDVRMFAHITVRFRTRGARPRDVISTFAMASVAPGETNPPKTIDLPVIRVTYDCLAKGTKIQLSSKRTVNIESIKSGMQVRSDASGLSLPVSEVTIGREAQQMIRIVDSIGHDLLLSTTHPIMTPDKGAVLAKTLTVGSKVLTDKGVSTLVKVTQEQYAGEVYNLMLNNSQRKDSADGSTLFANGFLVGDLTMQQAVELRTGPQVDADLLSRLPKEWHTDYHNSTKVARR